MTLYNPEPPSVVAGRPLLYDASHTSSHGDSACASCHIFGDLDGLAWDLGNPDAASIPNLNPITPLLPPFVFPMSDVFKSLKGPMVTQSLRGMANHGPMHWRGDRTGSLDAPNVQPDSGAYDEAAAFNQFNVAIANGGALNTSVDTAFNKPEQFETFNPFTETPVKGVHWDYAPESLEDDGTFGKVIGSGAYTLPRTFRFNFGVRF